MPFSFFFVWTVFILILFYAQLIQVFREFYPTQEDFITLECVWNSDKFELLERTHKSQIASEAVDVSLETSSVLYQSIESSLGGQCI